MINKNSVKFPIGRTGLFPKKSRSSKNSTPPDNPTEIFEQIQKKAYEIFERRSGQPGDALSDWLEAERLVKSNQAK